MKTYMFVALRAALAVGTLVSFVVASGADLHWT
jgi:hypothetical protein